MAPEIGVLIDAGRDLRMRDLHEERGGAPEEQEELAVQAARDRAVRQERVHTSGVRSFGYAIEGLVYLVRTQRNFRIHLLVALVAVATGAATSLNGVEWSVLVLTIAVVIMTEALNTGVELAVSLASPELRPEAKAAKDVAAAAVLLAATASVAVGIALFGPRVITLLRP
jgi:diacylglycerol kinase